MLAAFIGFLIVFGLLFLGAPIAFGMALVGFVGFAHFTSWPGALAMVGQISYETTISDELSVLPLFILMGSFINRAGLGQELYDCANAFLGHRRGGLAMATVVACGGFAAVSGSSMATAATMSKVAMPAMRRYGYADSLAAGSIAAGGTLGILIPPSVIMVLYGIMTSTDIGKLFIAGIMPGLIGIGFYMIAVATVTWLDPKLGPPGERSDWNQRLHALSKIWGVLLLFLIVMGGIYFGAVHADRSCRHRLRRRLSVRAGAPENDDAGAVQRAGRNRAHFGDDVHPADRRAHLFQFHQRRRVAESDVGLVDRASARRRSWSCCASWRSIWCSAACWKA